MRKKECGGVVSVTGIWRVFGLKVGKSGSWEMKVGKSTSWEMKIVKLGDESRKIGKVGDAISGNRQVGR